MEKFFIKIKLIIAIECRFFTKKIIKYVISLSLNPDFFMLDAFIDIMKFKGIN